MIPIRILSSFVGILVHGSNHFILEGTAPDREAALALVRHWSLIQIGAVTPPFLQSWRIVSRAFRENLEWAVVVGVDDEEHSAAVAVLLEELEARGIAIIGIDGKPRGQNGSGSS